MKQCSKCKKRKKETKFSKSASHKDGLRAWCKKCEREYTRKYYRRERKPLRKYYGYEQCHRVANAESGRLKASFTKDANTKMDWQTGAKNVQIKLPTKHAGGGRQQGIEKGIAKVVQRIGCIYLI